MNEGRHDCEVAQTLLRLWIHTLAASKHDTLYDFFQQLLEEFKKESAEHNDNTISVFWLAEKIRTLAKLPFHIGTTTSPEEVRAEIVQRIHEEVAQLQAYCKIWQCSAGYLNSGERSVESELTERITDVVHPWPQIQQTPA